MKKYCLNRKGVTLIEVILAITLFSMVMITLTTFLSSNIFYYTHANKNLTIEQSTRFALSYIEKCIREIDNREVEYHTDLQAIEGKNSNNEVVWIDFSGNRRNDHGTLVYFHRDTNALRTNKSNENNVLTYDIEDIVVTEIIEGELLEVKVKAQGLNYYVKTRIRLNYR